MPRARPLWARFLAASLVIVISMAAATSISILLYLTDIAKGLSDNEKFASLQSQLTDVDGGDPQTILIIGSDKRLGTKGDPGRSDTTILLRVDPEKHAIALLSIPRDLKVNIPGYGVDKFNEAFSDGGPDKTLKVVKQLTGLEDQPRRQHRLHRASPTPSTRSAASTSTSTATTTSRPTRASPRSTSRPATSGCAATTRSSTSASATSTTTSCAPRASRTSCARRARSCRRGS